MALDFKVLQKVKGNPSTEVAADRRLKIKPGQDYVYDLPKELIYTVIQEFPLKSLFSTDGETTEDFLAEQGRRFMSILIREADSETFRDRTADMIERVAQQTGIRFPHVFQRYVELGILTLRPRDAWTVTEATTNALKVRSFNCSLGKMCAEKGINNCHTFCLAANEVAAERAGTNLHMDYSKDFDGSGLCELSFRLLQGG
ncbi:hypothetical protein [Desulfosporosinus sp. BICA1-9]|uniref:hypothetical protein n=1 Tax=Desulfosporosinus sp. BICA1-9 TaxID=1531958 RepID=UPI00054BFFEB|nr:hypothetical protein [Desulfosporosinus sp. BICA1-9]KJS48495.1 MAG: hypothetical protein VR66_13675 [Peptococcaceae bacterium BRH_c23]KJS90677.1 MAG: hypothetical protein JL57_00685 [Desulfosporosinus sp. BICA1-9]HBW34938.1 hypothetical protein [Desulfosporosinus sp.]